MIDLFLTLRNGSTFRMEVDRIIGSSEYGISMKIGGLNVDFFPHEEQPDSCLTGSTEEQIPKNVLVAEGWVKT